jgi:type III secretory pathway component EscT
MKNGVLTRDTPKIEVIGARLSIGAAVTVLLLLASLHVLSPEFDPSLGRSSLFSTSNSAFATLHCNHL